ncbi:MAG: MucBP domain-containing protein [Clostridiales bacterium]|nr:MucBP domain-containing protein [Clostridiales bacterium]
MISGADKNKFNAGMAGEKIELRTIVQNLSDVTERYVTMKVWIKRTDGTVATTVGGSKLEATKTFTIPVWSEKSKFWAKGALEYKGSDFNSGLASCSLIYQIPADAVLYDGDTIAFEVTDENGNVLANDGTETQTYANVNIEYRFEDGSEIPNAPEASIPVPVGTTLDWTAPPALLGHTFIRAEGQNATVNGSGQTVTYYYVKQTDAHIHNWGDWISNGNGTHTRTCKKDSSHTETANCSGGTATCTEKAICAVCKTSYGETTPHSYGTWKKLVAATETESGTKGHYECSVCGKYFDKDGNEITDLIIAKIDAHRVIVTGGTLNGDKEFVKAGETITITADEPTDGKVFKGWKDGNGEIVSTDKNYTFTVSGEVNLTAVYDDLSSSEIETGGSGKESGTISGGKIAGIVIGTMLLAGIGGFAIFWFAVKRKTFADLGAAIKASFGKKK